MHLHIYDKLKSQSIAKLGTHATTMGIQATSDIDSQRIKSKQAI